MNESLLKTIDSIEELTMEAEMDVIYAMEQEYFKVMTLCEYCSPEAVSYIMEADNTTPTPEGSKPPKEGIFKKIGRVLKALLEAIKKKATALLNKLSGGRFNKDLKNVKGTPSQAMAKAKKQRKGKGETVTVQRGNVQDFFHVYMTEDGKRGFKCDYQKIIKMGMEAGIGLKTPILKHFLKKKYYGDTRELPGAVLTRVPLLKFYLDKRIMINNQVHDLMMLLSRYESEHATPKYEKDVQDLEGLFYQLITTDMASYMLEDNLEFSEEDIKKISEGISACVDTLPNIGNIPSYQDESTFKTLMSMYNAYMDLFSGMQMCLNVVYKQVDLAFELSDSDKNSCDAYDLDTFIAELLLFEYPEKYIHSLVYQAAKPEMKDACKEAKWGQFRGCLIPKNGDVVYKYALCRKGTKDNENEYDIYKTFESNGLDSTKYLCKPEVYTTFHNVIGMEKVKFNQKRAGKITGTIVKEIDSELKDKNINIKLSDIHSANIGFRKDGTPVISDYGSAKADKPDHEIIRILGQDIAV